MSEQRNSRWSAFRSSEEAIPSTPYEAGVFIANARLHLMTYGFESIDARELLTDAHFRVNASFFDHLEVA